MIIATHGILKKQILPLSYWARIKKLDNTQLLNAIQDLVKSDPCCNELFLRNVLHTQANLDKFLKKESIKDDHLSFLYEVLVSAILRGQTAQTGAWIYDPSIEGYKLETVATPNKGVSSTNGRSTSYAFSGEVLKIGNDIFDTLTKAVNENISKLNAAYHIVRCSNIQDYTKAEAMLSTFMSTSSRCPDYKALFSVDFVINSEGQPVPFDFNDIPGDTALSDIIMSDCNLSGNSNVQQYVSAIIERFVEEKGILPKSIALLIKDEEDYHRKRGEIEAYKSELQMRLHDADIDIVTLSDFMDSLREFKTGMPITPVRHLNRTSKMPPLDLVIRRTKYLLGPDGQPLILNREVKTFEVIDDEVFRLVFRKDVVSNMLGLHDRKRFSVDLISNNVEALAKLIMDEASTRGIEDVTIKLEDKIEATPSAYFYSVSNPLHLHFLATRLKNLQKKRVKRIECEAFLNEGYFFNAEPRHREIRCFGFAEPRETMISPREFVKYHSEGNSIKNKIHKSCIIYHTYASFEQAIRSSNAKLKEDRLFNHRKLYEVNVGDGIVLFYAGVGAAGSTKFLEELIELGARDIISIGSCGSINERIGFGDIVIPSFALIEEGVSRNYLPGLNKSQPSNALFERLRKNPNIIRLNPKIAGTRTTDSPFMQKTSEIEELLHQGICCTDMEASALFTVANYRGVHLASIFYVTDTYTNKQWTPKARDKQVNSIIDRLNAAVLSLWKEN